MSERRVIITGGTGSLGKALCQGFLQQGDKLAFSATNLSRAEQAVESMTYKDCKPEFTIGDFTDAESAEYTVKTLVDKLGGCDVLINNAGFGIKRNLWNATIEDWSKALSINLVAPFFACRAATRDMSKGGVVISVASESARLANAQSVLYPTAKAALIHMSQCLADELAPRGIRVLTVSPGAFKSNILLRSLGDATPQQQTDRLEQISKTIPLGYIAEAKHIADTVMFLVSQQAGYISGTDIVVDGGSSMPRR